MANFKTHVSVAALASLAVAGVAVKIQLISYDQILWLSFLGIVGGMLPDIDAGNSRPVRLLFNVLALLAVSATAELLQHRYGAYWVLGGAAAAYFTVRYGLFTLFDHFTEHRGVFHSLLAAVFFALLASCISYHFLHWPVLQAWLNGFFIVFGFIVHLLLDELFSVDLKNKRLKKSFGTALKLYHYQNLPASLSLLMLTMVLAWFAPAVLPIRQVIGLLHWHIIK